MTITQAIKKIESYYKSIYNPLAILDNCLSLTLSLYKNFDTKEDCLKAIEEYLKSYKDGVTGVLVNHPTLNSSSEGSKNDKKSSWKKNWILL